MRLYGTPPSHFTRKVRVVLQELKVPYEFVVLGNLLEVGEEKFAGNPLHLFPVLDAGDQRLFESSLICEYLIEKFGQGNELSAYCPAPENKIRDLQRMAVMNGAMSAGVSLVRAKRSGIENGDNFAFFRQEKEALAAALRWLEKDLGNRASYYPGRLTMVDITLQCLLEWAAYREMGPPVSKFPHLASFMNGFSSRPSFAGTHPSLQRVTQ